jgi:glycerol-3-phosphate cytidylyltransferase-like family protein
MKASGDKLVVIIHDDWSAFKIKDKIPIQDLKHRVNNLKITGLVDEIVTTDSVDPAGEFKRVIEKYQKHNLIYMRGDDLKENFPGQWFLEEYKVPIIFLPYTKGISSTKIKDMLIK